MNINFIEKAYLNRYNFDLKTYHEMNSSKLIIKKDLNELKRREIIFRDESGDNFEFITKKNLLYITNGSNIYPCTHIVNSHLGIKFTEVLLIPNGDKVIVENDIKFSAVIYPPYFNIFPLNKLETNIDFFLNFLGDYDKSFNENKWFDQNNLRFLINSNKSLSIYEKSELFEKIGSLNPFQLIILRILNQKEITAHDILKFIISENKTYRGIDYFNTPKDQIKFSNSTVQIITIDRYKEFFDRFSKDDIEEFLNLYMFENLDLANLKEEYLEIILNSHSKSIYDFSYNIELYKKYINTKLKEINLTNQFLEKFYKDLKLNILKLENIVRKMHGYDEVGSLYSEKYIFLTLQIHFPKLKIRTQYSPRWLGRQRIDIYIEEIQLAIEYNGKQHYEAINFFGGEQGLIETQKRDALKKAKCKEKGIELIEIRYDENIDKSIDKVKSIINERLNKI